MKSRKIKDLLHIKSHKNKNKNKIKNNYTLRVNHNNKTFKNKKKYENNNNVIIVGNAKTNLDNKFGKFIDNYDIIIRFNGFIIKNYEENVGTKTSIWVINDWVVINLLNKYKTWLENNKHIKIIIIIPYKLNEPENYYEERYKLINDFYNKSNIKNELIFINKDFVKKIQEKYEFNNVWPSSGLITILYFIELYKNINITGFNSFEKLNNNDNIHYYNDNQTNNHNGIKEKYIINELLSRKIIKKLLNQLKYKNIIIEKYKYPIEQSKNIDDYNINLAIVSCVNNPINFKFWIEHHINKCNVKKIFLRVQDSPELVGLLENYRNIIEPTYINNYSKFNIDYQDLQIIQRDYINSVIEKIKNDKNNILTHIAGNIDDDELLFLPNGLIPFYEDLINNNSNANYSIKNIEACYNNKSNNIFKSPYFCCNIHHFTSYVNGKSIGNLNEPIQAHRPHNFKGGSSMTLNSSNAIILHYESNCLKKWYNKYKSYSLNNIINGSVDTKIPFKFYQESINAFKNNIKNKAEIWERYKFAKYRDPNSLMKININSLPFIQNKIYLNYDPLIYIIDDYISYELCDHIIENYKDRLVPAKTITSDKNSKEQQINLNYRNNKSGWIHYTEDEKIENLYNNISKLINYPIENTEKIQLVNYNVGEKYAYHYDGYNLDDIRLNEGQRMVTCFIYLNNLKENQGGHTEFNKLNIKVAPKKGRLLVFYNTEKNSNKIHELSMHGGNEVLSGEKWACNIWFLDKKFIQ